MKDIRKRPFRTAPRLVPEELYGKSFQCPHCKTEVHVQWLEKLSFPKHPVKPNSGDGHWVPIDIPMVCSNGSCQKRFEVRTPIVPVNNRWTLYGDEAGRYISTLQINQSKQALHFFCITLVGLHRERQECVRKQIDRLKKIIAPGRDPSSWQHHFSRIWESDAASGEFNLPSKAAKVEHAKEFAKIIREARPELATFNISGCIIVPANASDRKKQIKAQKESIFCQSLLTSLQQFRCRNLAVNWVFDNINDATAKSRTEGWAAECFLGLQYTNLFTWLSAGATVLDPDFVKPGTHYLLEIADFISYCVARDFEKAVQNSSSEFPSSLLGQGFFQGTLGDGSVQYQWHHGLPIQDFYGINVLK